MEKAKKLYSLTEEHRQQLKPWAERWIKNATSTSAMTADDRAACVDAVKRLYRAANIEPPPDRRIIFVPSPFVMRFAAGFAAWILYCRRNRRGDASTRDATAAATKAATSAAILNATYAATYEATYEATYAAIRDATHEATYEATYASTRDATRSVTNAATYDATYEAILNATEEATRDATNAATYEATEEAIRSVTNAATYDATYEATHEATYEATYASTKAATSAATHEAIRDATHEATKAATKAATSAATYEATHEATRDATYEATYEATAAATKAATKAATSAATYEAILNATSAATSAATYEATSAATYEATYDATEEAIRNVTNAATEEATHEATHEATYEAIYEGTDEAAFGRWFVLKVDLVQCAIDVGVGIDGLHCAWQGYRLWQGGNQWSGWDSFLSFFRHVAKLDLDWSKWDAWETLSWHSGPRVVHKDFCIISDRPEVLKVDDQNRPHCDDGPFCRWRDGNALYAVHGVRVPAWIVERPEQITAKKVLAETNAEIRRVMLEQMGMELFIKDSGAQRLHEDEFGDLFQINLDGDEPLVTVRVMNSTQEPDGSRKPYFLRVHPECRPLLKIEPREYGEPQTLTALNAVASTFGMTGQQYIEHLVAES